MDDTTSFHMTPEEFRRWGHATVDWIAAYQQRVEALPVLSPVKPGQIRASLPGQPPLKGEALREHPGGCRAAHPTRHHALAIAEFLRLFPRQQLRPFHPGRAALGGPGGAGDVLGHQPRLHRAGNPRVGLDGGHGGPAGELQVRRQRAGA